MSNLEFRNINQAAGAANDILISQNSVEGIDYFNVWGENPDIDSNTDPEDIWTLGGQYVFPNSAAVNTMSSSSNSDDQTVKITGLDANWSPVVQTGILNGRNKVTLTTPLLRVNKVENDSQDDFDGDIYVYENTSINNGVPNDASKVKGFIKQGDNKSMHGFYTTPAGFNGFISKIVVGAKGNNKNADGCFFIREINKTFKKEFPIYINTEGGTFNPYKLSVPIFLPPKTDVLPRIEKVQSSNTGVAIYYTVILIQIP